MSYDLLPDLELIFKIKEHRCENSLTALIKRHESLYYQMFHRYASILEKKQISSTDILEEKDTLIYNAAISFDAGKHTKFSTWLANCVKFRCLKAIHKKPTLVSYSQEELTQIIDNVWHIDIGEKRNDDIDFIFHLISQCHDPRIKQVFLLRFFGSGKKNNSWAFVGEQLGISPQTAINLFQRGRMLVMKKMFGENFLDKI